jgi:PhoPQ-activated pathogenicity-related protein
MRTLSRLRAAALALLAVPWLAAAAPAPGADLLADYVAREQPAFGYHVRDGGRYRGADWIELIVTSQTWRGIPWRHQLYLIRPAGLGEGSHQALLFIDGGKWREEYEKPPAKPVLPKRAGLYREIAQRLAAPVAILKQVPNQPLLGGLTEDALIAHTLDRYLETGDADWPLLLPMVRSVVSAMDAVERYAHEEWSLDVSGFTVTGASKRGWTTWLTAASDPRVKAIAPMVFDVLNMEPQLAHQRASWGKLSEQIADYSALSLTEQLDTPGGAHLTALVDPFSYRERITQPKLLIYGSNDRYWPIDAASLYWDELSGPRLPLYIPNQGHKLTDVRRIIAGLDALHQYSARGRPLPDLSWAWEDGVDRLALEIRAEPEPALVRAWVAHSATRDFREAKWRSVLIPRRRGRYAYKVPRPADRYVAVYGEAVFGRGAGRVFFSTLPRIAGPEPLLGARAGP